jgi:hypothetical protein
MMNNDDLHRTRYKRAFELYCRKENADLIAIAHETGCHPETLQEFATRRNWPKKRQDFLVQNVQAKDSNRVAIAAKADAETVERMSGFLSVAGRRYDEILLGITSLPIDDPDHDARAKQLKRNSELLSEAIRGVGQLVESARSIGLVVSAKTAPTATEGRVDFAKLTSLSLTLIEAQREAGQEPIQVIEIEKPKVDEWAE